MKKIFSSCILFSLSMMIFSFDWPIEKKSLEFIECYFANYFGGTLNSSLIFKAQDEASASEDGTVVSIIAEHNDSMGWFESTLGNAIIINHDDMIYSVYANLDEKSAKNFISQKKSKIQKNEFLAQTGTSSWSDKNDGTLHFMIFDSKNAAAINPKILLSRTEKTPELTFGPLYLYDKNGTAHNIAKEKNLPSGKYTAYKNRQATIMPYSTILSVNGREAETLYYEIIKENKGVMGIQGKDFYSAKNIFEKDGQLFLGNINLSKGYNTITLSQTNALGKTTTATYSINNY